MKLIMTKKIQLIAVLLLMAIHIYPQDVAPMIQTHWGQGSPYNLLCPLDSTGNRPLAGCGPIAMAQVLNYLGVRSSSVQQLIRDCGISAFTQYGKDRSSSKTIQNMNAMKKLYHCSPYMNLVRRDEYLGDEGKQEWDSLITRELRQGRVVIISGSSDKSGHTFILDGVKGNLIHANLGWTGHYDGYYPLDSLYQYTQKQIAIVNIGDSTYVPHIDTIHVEKAGTLQMMMQNTAWRKISHLCISGSINDDDIHWLRSMAAYNYKSKQYKRLKSLDLSATDMTYLPDSAFVWCDGLTYVQLPKQLVTIGKDAFKFDRGINQVVIPTTVRRIRSCSFAFCPQLLDIQIPEGVTNILSYSFFGCTYLTNVKLPSTIDTIGVHVFDKCTRLEHLYIPASATQIGLYITNNCPNAQIHIDPRNPKYEVIDGKIYDKKKHEPLEKPLPLKKPNKKVHLSVFGPVFKNTYKMVNGKRVLLKSVRIR